MVAKADKRQQQWKKVKTTTACVCVCDGVSARKHCKNASSESRKLFKPHPPPRRHALASFAWVVKCSNLFACIHINTYICPHIRTHVWIKAHMLTFVIRCGWQLSAILFPSTSAKQQLHATSSIRVCVCVCVCVHIRKINCMTPLRIMQCSSLCKWRRHCCCYFSCCCFRWHHHRWWQTYCHFFATAFVARFPYYAHTHIHKHKQYKVLLLAL